jgi:hypothetical protein
MFRGETSEISLDAPSDRGVIFVTTFLFCHLAAVLPAAFMGQLRKRFVASSPYFYEWM